MPIPYAQIESGSFAELLSNVSSILITTHVNPDGDALGSEIGLADWLVSIGKEVRIVNHSPTPPNYTFLEAGRPMIEIFESSLHDALAKTVDLALVLDVNDPDRTRSLAPYLKGDVPVAVIDHHLEPKEFASQYYVDVDASSTGELIYRLIRASQPELGGQISHRAAMALYVAIMTDTGSFRFPRTDAELLRQCADLIELGADPVAAYEEVYNTSPATRLLLIRESMNSLEYHYERRCAVQFITQEQIRKIGADEEEVDGFVQIPFQVKGIVLSIFILELRSGWKISVRSKGQVSAARLAQSFGGNGHFHAAGARIGDPINLNELLGRVILEAGHVLAAV